ncbi:hypothetical protein CRM22_003732 [Opisthorchis felineus]|uniref:FHA domain-containing protein n=1 Tax=Opisthorchis felineus TaxID=147828 RepID=A0A4V3SFR5_OPIFE|nr:hypothetical protein CRM22_003732 [Opisthorchis felineus]
MNAYLQAVGWVYPLSPKVTTIGRSGCDIIINNASVDQQHAVIERDENQNVHILRDLCSEKGTYINNIPIQDAAVILKQGDQIRFGSFPTVYGFELGTLIGRSGQGDPAQLRSDFVTTRASVPLWVQSNQTEGRENKSSNADSQDQTFPKIETRTSDHGNLKQPSEKPEFRKTPEEELAEKDTQIRWLQKELDRLAPLEAISNQKDILIRQLQEQLFQKSNNSPHQPLPQPGDTYLRPSLQPGNAFTSQTDEGVKPSAVDPLSRSKSISLTVLTKKSGNGKSPATTSPPNGESDRSAFERINRERKVLSGLVTQLQGDLSRKDDNIARLSDEVKGLRQQLEEREVALATLHAKHANAVDATERARENEAYEKAMTILRQKHKASEMRCDTLKVELEETRMKLEKAQKTTEDKETSEIKLRGKLEKLKVKLGELERSERQALSAVQENQNKYKSLRNRIMRVLFAVRLNQPSKVDTTEAGDYRTEAEVSAASLDSILTGEWDDPAGRERSNNALVDDMDDNHIVDRLQSMIEQMVRLKRQVSEEEEQRRKRRTIDRGIENDLDIFVNLLVDTGEPSFESTKFRSSLRIKNQLDKIAAHSTPFRCLQRLQNTLVDELEKQLAKAQQVENCIRETVSKLEGVYPDFDVNTNGTVDDLITILRRLIGLFRSAQCDRKELQKRLIDTEHNHREELKTLEMDVRRDLQRKIDDALAQNNEEHAEKQRRAIEEVTQIETNRNEQMLVVKQAIIDELERKLREAQQLLSKHQADFESERQDLKLKCNELEDLQKQIGDKDSELTKLQAQLEQVKISTERATEAICEERWRNEVAGHREQAKQHARTICVLEDRLMKLAKQAKETKTEIQRLKRQNSELQSEHKMLQGRFGETQQLLSSVRRKSSEDLSDRQQQISANGEYAIKQKEVEFMQLEISRLKQLLDDRDVLIESLRADLRGARAQLSDLRGELSEAQKEEVECAIEFGKRVSAELTDAKAKLSQQEHVIQGFRDQTAEKDANLKKQVAAIEELRKTMTAQEEEISRLTELLECERGKQSKTLSKSQSVKKTTEDLAALGNECRGERHREIIEKQRDALCQLRQQLQEQSYLGRGGDQSEQPRELASLRREIAELRSQQIMSEVLPSIPGPQGQRMMALDKGWSASDEGYSTCRCERTKVDTATDVLHASEEGYLDLVKSIAEQLQLGTLPGQRSLTYASALDRDTLQRERRQVIDLLRQRIAALQEQVHRKEQLLANYERDMCRLTQAEALVALKGEQIENMFSNLRSKESEISLLRHALNQTREELMEEKRLSAAKKGRTTKTIQQTRAISSAARRKESHGSPQSFSVTEQRKKEPLKKQQYESKVLRNERCRYERQYSGGTEAITNLRPNAL